MLSEAKHLSGWVQRCFASLSMTGCGLSSEEDLSRSFEPCLNLIIGVVSFYEKQPTSYPSFCKKLATVRIPLKNCEREYFSFGACRLSSGRPKPINTTGACNISAKRAAMGMEPPSRRKMGSLA